MSDTLTAPASGEAAAEPMSPGFKPEASPKIKMEDLIPWEYLLRTTQRKCLNCGSVHKMSELFLVYVHPRWTGSTQFRKLVPIDDTRSLALPVGQTTGPLRNTPICHSCIDLICAESLGAPRPQATDAQWAQSLAASARQTFGRSPTPSPKAPPAATKPKIDIDKLEF
jgi:hypothetical protein